MRVRTIILIISVLLMTWPSEGNACNGACDEIYLLFFGVPATLVSTFITPLIGLAIDSRENRPYYWRVVGFTALGSSAGAGIAYLSYDNSKTEDENIGDLIVTPLLFGAVATTLTHILLPRRSEKTSNVLWQPIPEISFLPVVRGGSIKLNWSF